MSRPWYETFFEGLALDLWRAAFTPELTRAEVDFAERELALPPGARVLDVPCGSGRHSLELARRGYHVTGVDLSSGFMAEARSASKAAQLSNVQWLETDMRHLPAGVAFDGALCLGNSFGYLDHEGSLEFLAAVFRSLRPGGRFLLETGAAAECLLPNLEERTEYTLGEVTMQTVSTYSAWEGRLYGEDTFIRGDAREVKQSSQAIYTAAEIRRMLHSAGFVVKKMCGGTDGSEFRLGSRDLLLIAEK